MPKVSLNFKNVSTESEDIGFKIVDTVKCAPKSK